VLLTDVIVRGGLGRVIPNIAGNERKIAGAILACWSVVHGLTMLLLDGLVGPAKKSGELCDSVVTGLLDGLAAKLNGLRLARGSARSRSSALSLNAVFEAKRAKQTRHRKSELPDLRLS
jgi:hypothetical protein